MADRFDLTALLGSRICHDLISPIGAIGNGVELLVMEGLGKGPEITLISESVANASARIRYFRIAFGASNTDQRVGRPEIQSILDDLTRGSRLTIDWQAEGDQLRREVKLVFLAIQCLETAMAYGGIITIQRMDSRWTIKGTATKMKIDPDLWETLSNPAAQHEITAAQVHFALMSAELATQGRKFQLDVREADIRLSF